MKRSLFIALLSIVCGVMVAGTGAFAEQAAEPSGAATANGATDSTLEIAPNYPQPSSTPQPGNADAGTAQDYANNQDSNAAPLPKFAGIDDYINQQTLYESVSTGLPPMALIPSPAYYPYYYPGFYSWPRPPIVMMPPPIYRPPPSIYHPQPPRYLPPGHGGFHHR